MPNKRQQAKNIFDQVSKISSDSGSSKILIICQGAELKPWTKSSSLKFLKDLYLIVK